MSQSPFPRWEAFTDGPDVMFTDTVMSTPPLSATTSFSWNGRCQTRGVKRVQHRVSWLWQSFLKGLEQVWHPTTQRSEVCFSFILQKRFSCFMFFCWFFYHRNRTTVLESRHVVKSKPGWCGWLLSRSLITPNRNKVWPATLLERLASSRSAWGTCRTCPLRWHFCQGSPLRPFPRVLLCPRNIPKLRSCMGLVIV